MEANFQLPEAESKRPGDENQLQEISSDLNNEQVKLSYGAFGRLARILIDIARNPTTTNEQQNATPNEQ